MNYEQAKQLKDAGFPIPKEAENIMEMEESFDGKMIAPTLSELIEACGEDFFALKVYHEPDVEWVAMLRESTDDLSQTFGKTPEEAVAKLWLALNKKA